MGRVAVPARVGLRGIDTTQVITPAIADGLKARGIEYVMRYLGSLTSAEVDVILGAGLLVGAVCYADAFNGQAAAAAAQSIGLPTGMHVFADLESDKDTVDAVTYSANDHGRILRSCGYKPGGYVGVNQPLSGRQLGGLIWELYWKAASSALYVPEPCDLHTGAPIGWGMIQLVPGNIPMAGTLIDLDVVQQDYRGRVPILCAAG